MKCSKCGADNQTGNFCSKCGSEIINTEDNIDNNSYYGSRTIKSQKSKSPKIIAKKVALGILITCTVLFALVVIIALLPSPDTKPVSNQAESEQTKPSTTAEQIVSVSASKLCAAYKENEVNADNTYKNKKVEITGTVVSIGKDALNQTYVLLSDNNQYSFLSVQCYINNSSLEQVANLKPGDSITIKGECGGFSINVLVYQGEIA